MIITIDTKKDSHDDIKRAIDLLHRLTQTTDTSFEMNSGQSSQGQNVSGMMNMFSSDKNEEQNDEEPKPDIPSIATY